MPDTDPTAFTAPRPSDLPADHAELGGLGDLPGQLAELAGRADDFELPADPYQAVRERRRALRRRNRRVAVVAAAAAVAVLVAGIVTGDLLLPRHPDRVRPVATPTDAPPHSAPRLPSNRAVVGHGTVATGLASPCNRGNCPVLLETMDPGGRTHWYQLPVQLLASSVPYTPLRRASLSPDGRWVELPQAGETSVLRDLAGTRTIRLASEEGLRGWQPWLAGSGPLRWALSEKDSPADINAGVIYRIDLETGTRVAYPRGAAAWNNLIGVLPSGDLVLTFATQDPSTTVGDVLVRTIDPVTRAVRHEVRVPQDDSTIFLGGTLTPDGGHMMGDGGYPFSEKLLVDLVTGALTRVNLIDVASSAPGATRPVLVNDYSEWPVGFVAGSTTYETRIRSGARMYVLSVRLDASGGTVRAVGVGVGPFSLLPPRAAPGEFATSAPLW